MTTPGVTREDRPPAAVRKLQRSRRDRVVAGICGGLGEYFAIDPLWFRIAFIALTFGGGAGVLLYVIGWIAIPEVPADSTEGEPEVSRPGTGIAILGAVLVMIGMASLFGRFLPDLSWITWPLVLIAVGAGIVWKGVQR